MADFATALRGRLRDDAGVTAITDKIYWVIVPQDKQPPYIRLQTISDPRPQHLKAYDTARVVRVQADCFAKAGEEGAKTARALAEAVIAAVADPEVFGGVAFGRVKAEGPRDLGEDTPSGFINRASVDLLVEHRMA